MAGGFTRAAAAAPLALPALSFPTIAFASDHVDATSGTATVTLNWALADRSTAATAVQGVVHIQQFSGSAPVGAAQLVHYALTQDETTDTWAVSGDAQLSNYSYAFPVPRYGPTASTSWRIVKITASDDQGHSRTLVGNDLGRYQVRLAATGLVDSTPPTVGILVRDAQQEPFAYDAGGGATVRYALEILDAQAGFWKGRVSLTGPGGVQVTTPIRVVDTGDFFLSCGGRQVFAPDDVACAVRFVLPAGSPTGSWSVTAVELTDNAGNSTRVTDLHTESVQVTRNDVLSATDFSVSPALVNNWRAAQEVAVTLRPVGARGGLQSFVVRTDEFIGPLPGLTINPDGTATVRLLMPLSGTSLTVNGIALVDGEGNVALYGSHFGAPALDLSATRLPDTTPPVVLAATLSRTTIPASELAQSGSAISVDATVDTSPAPVTDYSVTFYDSTGRSVGGGSGRETEVPAGTVHLGAFLRGLSPGTYTAGFTLFDAAGLHAQYGYPNGVGQPAPSGPLVLTVTDG